MAQRDDLLRRLESANPVPDPDRLEDKVLSRRLLANVAQRKEADMADTDIAQLAPASDRRRPKRGLALAVAAFLVVVAAGVGAFLALTSGSDDLDMSTATPVEISEAFFQRLEAGDPAGAAALVSDSHSGIRFPVQGLHAGAEGLIDYLGFYEATNGRTRLADCVEVSSGIVSCGLTQTSDVVAALGLDPLSGTMTFTLGDGGIRGVNFTISGTALAEVARSRDAFEAWIVETHPDMAADMFEGGELVKNPETGRRYLQLASEYADASGA